MGRKAVQRKPKPQNMEFLAATDFERDIDKTVIHKSEVTSFSILFKEMLQLLKPESTSIPITCHFSSNSDTQTYDYKILQDS